MPDSPAPVRDAATVILLRGADDGPEVLMLRRHGRSGFAADAWVFPGGVVDAADRSLPAACWHGIDPARLTQRFAAGATEVLGFHVAAVRETFEEAGLLLASRADGTAVDLEDPAVQRLRHALAERTATVEFATRLAAEELVLDLGCLTYLSRWVTPTAERRRYDTCFFLARAPRGQVADHDRVETTGQRWLAPATALDEHRAGRLHLIYPTIKTLEALTEHRTAEALVAAAAAQPEVPSILPHIQVGADGRFLRVLHPDDGDFPRERYEVGR
ncbi:MAG: NUDIX hydrolase [Egibacteraceae bacterium]